MAEKAVGCMPAEEQSREVSEEAWWNESGGLMDKG